MGRTKLRAIAPAALAALALTSAAVVDAARLGWTRRHHAAWQPWYAGDGMRPGQYVWRGAAGGGPVRIVIDLGRQRAYVYQGAAMIGVSTISTGRPGYDTPTGVFPILEKAVWHRSTTYSNAPMPYMQRLTWGGVALHAGGVPGYRQSHGCIHLPRAFAQALFRVTSLGGEVDVVGDTRMTMPVTLASALLPSTAQAVAEMIALSS